MTSRICFAAADTSSCHSNPVFALPDRYGGPGGITWLQRWPLTQGTRGVIFAGEPTVPGWIEQAALPHTKG